MLVPFRLIVPLLVRSPRPAPLGIAPALAITTVPLLLIVTPPRKVLAPPSRTEPPSLPRVNMPGPLITPLRKIGPAPDNCRLTPALVRLSVPALTKVRAELLLMISETGMIWAILFVLLPELSTSPALFVT